MPPKISVLTRLAGAALLLLAPAASAAVPTGGHLEMVQVTSGLSAPVGVFTAGDGSGRLFIVQQPGQIRIWNGSQLLATPFLDLSSVVTNCGSPPNCGERGLLGLAFHPSYATNGLFYVYYTRAGDGAITVARYQVSSNPDVALTSGTVLLTIPHARSNHNGGQLAFGPNGYLYIGTGDGGAGGDPDENGQNLNTLLGKILRIDVNGDDSHGPAATTPSPPATPSPAPRRGADEIWAYGLRNPWRFSFDRATGDL